MTWDGENRFGGGVGSKQGLKEDGKRLLEWMTGKQIAIDFSHTSDALAEGILTHIDQERLVLPVMASHSNFRSITDCARNMPDWLAQELIRRKGILGLTLFAPFIHKSDPTAIIRHVEYALSSLAHKTPLHSGPISSAMPTSPAFRSSTRQIRPFSTCLEMPPATDHLRSLASKLSLKEEQLRKIGSENAQCFIQRLQANTEP